MKPNTYDESLKAVLDRSGSLGTEWVTFHHVLNRVLAEPVRAQRDDPEAPISAMDGFALRAQDTAGANRESPREFTFSEVVGAGHHARGRVAAHSAIRIMTGAPMPAGADAVVKQEDTVASGEGRFTLAVPLDPGENVIQPGARIARQAELAKGGKVVTPQALALLAGQCGRHLSVVRRPRVALLALGDELVEVGARREPGQITVSNLHALTALSTRYGAAARPLGIAPDNPGLITRMLRPVVGGAEEGASAHPLACEIIITLGGSHRGDFDFVEQVLGELGCTLHFRQTRLNMAGSTLFASKNRTLLFGLPGTPLSSWLGFEVLVRPALLKLAGWRDWRHPRVRARLEGPCAVRPGRTSFVPARLEFTPQGAVVRSLAQGRLADLAPSLLANALIVRHPDAPPPKEGDQVEADWLGEA